MLDNTTNTKKIFASVDTSVLFIYIALMLIGWVSIYAAVYDPSHQSIVDSSQRYGKQGIFIATSLLIFVIVMTTHQHTIEGLAFVVYGLMVVMLIGVLIYGKKVNGARAWFEIGAFALQPAEFSKISTLLALAAYLDNYNTNLQKAKTQIVCAILLAIPAILILLQPDTGSVLVYASLVFVLYREGLSGNYLLFGGFAIVMVVLSLIFNKFVIIGILAFTLLGYVYFGAKKWRSRVWFALITLFLGVGLSLSVDYAMENILEPHQRTRVKVLLGLEEDPKGTGYNVRQSLIAIGSGGFLGKGFLQGTQTKFNFVPEQSTDFIFCTIGEEFGFWGTVVVIVLFGALIYKLVEIAERQTYNFARIYGYGVASIIFFHVFINIGMTIGLLPVIGIPLPFISYGGSSLWAFTILLAILLKLDAAQISVRR